MRIKTNKEKSIAGQLTDILNSKLPRTANTGLNKDLGVVKTDPKSKGKSVLFAWRNETFRLSENLKVMEKDFTNTWRETEASKEVESIVKGTIETVKEQVEEKPSQAVA